MTLIDVIRKFKRLEQIAAQDNLHQNLTASTNGN